MKNLHAVMQNFFSDGIDDFRPTPSRMAPEYGVYTSLGPMVDDVRDGANSDLFERLDDEAETAFVTTTPPLPVEAVPQVVVHHTYRQVERNATDMHLQTVIASRGETVVALRRRHQTKVTTSKQTVTRKKWSWVAAAPKEMEPAA